MKIDKRVGYSRWSNTIILREKRKERVKGERSFSLNISC